MQMLRRAQSFVTPLRPIRPAKSKLRRYVSRRSGRGGSTAPTQRQGCAVDTILVSRIAKPAPHAGARPDPEPERPHFRAMQGSRHHAGHAHRRIRAGSRPIRSRVRRATVGTAGSRLLQQSDVIASDCRIKRITTTQAARATEPSPIRLVPRQGAQPGLNRLASLALGLLLARQRVDDRGRDLADGG